MLKGRDYERRPLRLVALPVRHLFNVLRKPDQTDYDIIPVVRVEKRIKKTRAGVTEIVVVMMACQLASTLIPLPPSTYQDRDTG